MPYYRIVQSDVSNSSPFLVLQAKSIAKNICRVRVSVDLIEQTRANDIINHF